MAAPRPPSSHHDAVPVCPCCMMPFRGTQSDDTPCSFLPCGHTACASCAEAVAASSICPVCSTSTQGIVLQDLGLAAFAESVMKGGGVLPAASSAPMCADCEGDEDVEPATHMCRSCSDLLVCAIHEPLHSRKKKHETVPLGTAPPAGSGQCPLHPGTPCSRFCTTDNRVICAECALGEHASHSMQLLETCTVDFKSALADALAVCALGSSRAANGHAKLLQARQRLLDRKEVSCMRLEADAAAVKAAIDTHVSSVIAAASREVTLRLKAIDVQLDQLTVATNQLACAAAMCQRAVEAGSKLDCALALQSAARVAVLATPYQGPCVSTVVEVLSSLEDLISGIAGCTRLRLGVDATASTVSGRGTAEFQLGEPSSFVLQLRDAAGAEIDTLDAEDVTLWCVEDAAVLSPPSLAPSGAVTVSYVTSTNLAAVTIAVNVAGCGAVAQAPWVAKALPAAVAPPPRHKAAARAARSLGAADASTGASVVPCDADVDKPVHTYRVIDTAKDGLAVNADASLVVIAAVSHSLTVYSGTGSCVRTIGGYGTVPGRFKLPFRVCFTPAGNILVADTGNHRLQEFTTAGSFIRAIENVRSPRGLCCSATLIYAGNRRGGDHHAIEVYDLASGTLLRGLARFGAREGMIGGSCDALALSPDGKLLAAGEATGCRVSVFGVDGTFVRCLGTSVLCDGAKDVAFCPAGALFVTDYSTHRVLVFSVAHGTLLRSFGGGSTGAGTFRHPSALAIAASCCFVVDKDTPRLHVFRLTEEEAAATAAAVSTA